MTVIKINAITVPGELGDEDLRADAVGADAEREVVVDPQRAGVVAVLQRGAAGALAERREHGVYPLQHLAVGVQRRAPRDPEARRPRQQRAVEVE